MFHGEDTDIWCGTIQIDKTTDFFLTWIREDEGTLLQFPKADRLQMLTQNITKLTLLLRDIEKDNAPTFIPTQRLVYLNFFTKNILISSPIFPRCGESKEKRPIFLPYFFKKLLGGECPEGSAQISLINTLPFFGDTTQNPI